MDEKKSCQSIRHLVFNSFSERFIIEGAADAVLIVFISIAGKIEERKINSFKNGNKL
ncbi:MAG: hypothetical protein ABIW38_05005 [Ferruginibacter sp.]